MLLFLADPARAPDKDIDILTRALKKSLGETTNYDSPRVAKMELDARQGKHLILVLNGNYSPTPAGLRHGVFGDVITVMRVLKSWDWPDRIAGVTIVEQIPSNLTGPKKTSEFVVLFKGHASSSLVRKTNWKAVRRESVPEILARVEVHEILQGKPN